MKTELSQSIHIDKHSKAVSECQTAFEELKQNYEKDNHEKDRTIQGLTRTKERVQFLKVVLKTLLKIIANLIVNSNFKCLKKFELYSESDLTEEMEKLKHFNVELETELKICKKMMKKYEELCMSLQEKLLVVARNRAEAEEFAKKCEEEADTAR